MNKIAQIIEKEIGRGGDSVVLSYLLDKGIENLKTITEDSIKNIKGNNIMTAEYCQALVRAAVRIAKECDTLDIARFIRCEAYFNPGISKIELGKEAMSDYGWEYLCNEMDVDPEEADYMSLKFIVEEQ